MLTTLFQRVNIFVTFMIRHSGSQDHSEETNVCLDPYKDIGTFITDIIYYIYIYIIDCGWVSNDCSKHTWEKKEGHKLCTRSGIWTCIVPN